MTNLTKHSVSERLAMYDGEDGLREKMIAINASVPACRTQSGGRAQYGANSPEYLSVKGIKV